MKKVYALWIIMFVLGIPTIFMLNLHFKKMKEEYSLIETSSEFYGIVKSARRGRTVCNIALTNGTKVAVRVSRNYSYKKADLCDNVNPGDTIKKGAYSDSVFIWSGTSRRHFLYGNVIGDRD